MMIMPRARVTTPLEYVTVTVEADQIHKLMHSMARIFERIEDCGFCEAGSVTLIINPEEEDENGNPRPLYSLHCRVMVSHAIDSDIDKIFSAVHREQARLDRKLKKTA